ncbi:hypothetical protein Y032_0155g3056 [Ancylostoma ceylanicum]|uniref:Uncharacterized protein n=1 Tax=Ancylostoma ceylanicum TaxID=53326 RepID=A0A016SZG0_9BILA|nr:hypothetical protein Y032_0155g3056 [Ancylostoma ceylanicum]
MEHRIETTTGDRGSPPRNERSIEVGIAAANASAAFVMERISASPGKRRSLRSPRSPRLKAMGWREVRSSYNCLKAFVIDPFDHRLPRSDNPPAGCSRLSGTAADGS